MLSTLFCLIIFGVVIAAFYTAERRFFEAIRFHLQNRHEEAIYQYAVATLTSCFFKEICRQQISYLWKKYGPFDYSDIYNTEFKFHDRESTVSRDAVVEIIKSSLIS